MSDKMRESAIALMEAAMIAGVDEYFSARPQLMRTRHEECLYEAGFKRAWQAAHAAALPPGFVAVPVEPTEAMLDAVAPFPEHLRHMHEGDAAWESAMQAATNADKMAVRQNYVDMLAARPEVK